ncbi:transketolase family protein [Patescibacteria group bacterium]
MLNKNLNQKVFDEDVERVPTRNGYGDGLLQAGEENEDVVALCADLTSSTRTNLFADKFPERFIQVGVAEQNLATVASGMSAMGKIPFIASYGMFSPGRNWEQIRTTICYNNANVKIVGAHAGVSVGPDGGTHQAIEDIAIMRVIPRMIVLYPCDSVEAKKAVSESVKIEGPVYIRLAREKTPVITTESTPFEIGKAQRVFETEKPQVGIIGSGPLLYNALVVAKELVEEGVNVTVLNLSTIKPLDGEAVLKLSKEVEGIVTVEEHQVAGGVGSAVAEFLAKNHPTKIEFVGIKDEFGQSGKPEELIEYYNIGVKGIKEAVKHVLNR